jgi:hypothetical protein
MTRNRKRLAVIGGALLVPAGAGIAFMRRDAQLASAAG